MYNLLKWGNIDFDLWERNQGALFDVSFLRDRMFEHTDKAIKERFTSNDDPDFDALMKHPCLFTYEGIDVTGSIGRITDVGSRQRMLEIVYTLPGYYPQIAIKDEMTFKALGMGPNESWERGRSHWAVKDVDLFEVATRILHKAGSAPIALSQGDMNRVWGSDHRRKQLVFLSHRAAHQSEVSIVRDYLENEGFCCFLAHKDITPSLQWQGEILKALDTMQFFVGFLTNDFHTGGWPDQEIGYAYQRNVPRVFVKVDGVDPMGMVGAEQALTTTWHQSGADIAAHLKQIST